LLCDYRITRGEQLYIVAFLPTHEEPIESERR